MCEEFYTPGNLSWQMPAIDLRRSDRAQDTERVGSVKQSSARATNKLLNNNKLNHAIAGIPAWLQFSRFRYIDTR